METSLRPSSQVPVFDRPETNRTDGSTTWNFLHTSRFSTGRQVPIIAGQSSWTQESIGVFTQPDRLAGQVKTGVCERFYKQHVHYCWLSYWSVIVHSSGQLRVLRGGRQANSRTGKRPGRVNTPMLPCVLLLCPAIIGTCRPVENRKVWTRP
jgi:hypothetical protein